MRIHLFSTFFCSIFLLTSYGQEFTQHKNCLSYSPISIERTTFTLYKRYESVFSHELFYDRAITDKFSWKTSVVFGLTTLKDKPKEPVFPVSGTGRLKEAGITAGFQYNFFKANRFTFSIGSSFWGSYYSYKGSFSTSTFTNEVNKSATILGFELDAQLCFFANEHLSFAINPAWRYGRGEMVLENPALDPWNTHAIITPLRFKVGYWFK